jgi:hypothetical protein
MHSAKSTFAFITSKTFLNAASALALPGDGCGAAGAEGDKSESWLRFLRAVNSRSSTAWDLAFFVCNRNRTECLMEWNNPFYA